jgi:hypothetical protein
MLIALTEVFANTPAALLLLQRFAWQRLPGGAPSYDSNGRAYLRLYADDLDELKHSATAERLTWQAARFPFAYSFRRSTRPIVTSRHSRPVSGSIPGRWSR